MFDPTRCPLLQGLTTEQADEMMARDPRIRACMGAIAAGATSNLEPCVAKMVAAHDKQTGRTGGRRSVA
ncbi:MAG: hypothetical protein LWW93_01560 [Hyphomicrobiales bacterium]|nr:hypothetical protein [Hyphomicrobiales bacterium]